MPQASTTDTGQNLNLTPQPKPPLSLAELAVALPEARVVGDASVVVAHLVHPRMVTHEQAMALILEESALEALGQSSIPVKAAIVDEGITVPDGLFDGYIVVNRPRYALAFLLAIFEKPLHVYKGIHPMAMVESTAKVHPTASVGAFVYVGADAVVGANTVLMPHVTVGAEAQIGEQCLFHPGVRIGERIIIRNRVIIHHNASIGSDGFSYVTEEPGSVESAKNSGGKVTRQNHKILKISSIGTVILEDDVEVGACTTIDRSNLGATLIRKGTKIDNLVMIGHNNTIGENCMLVSQAGIAGSCEIGDRVVIAGQAGLGDHLKIGDDAIIMAKSGVMNDIKAKEVVVGLPALPQRQTFQNVMYIGKLRGLFKEVKDLKRRLEALELEIPEKDNLEGNALKEEN